MSLADLGLPTSPADYLTLWQNTMAAAFPGYTPNPGSLEYVQAQVFASWAADVAQMASAGSTDLFRQFGTQLLGLPYEQGTPALAVISVTAADTAGYTLPQGTQLTFTLAGSQVGFQTATDLTIPNGSTTGTVTAIAVSSGTAFNGAAAPIQLVTSINWVSSVALITAASGGVDQENDDAYVQRLALTLQTLGYATVTASAYATRAGNFIPDTGTDQEEVGRATAVDGYSPLAASFTVSTTSGSPNLTVTGSPAAGVTAAPGAAIKGTNIPSATFTANTTLNSTTLSSISSFTNLQVGALVSGSGVPAGTEILSINSGAATAVMSMAATATASSVTITCSTAIVDSSSGSIVMSANATGTGSGITATVGGTLGNERTITVCITDSSGNALNTDTMTAVQAYLQTFREVGFVINVVEPSYSTIFVTVSVLAASGFAAAAVQSNVQAALLAYLSPVNFGLPPGAVQGWQNSQTVYRSAVTAVIQNTLGVRSVVPNTLAIGLAASPTNTTTDLVLPGAFPLPISSTTSIPTSAITVS
jgi:hypothetical protein